MKKLIIILALIMELLHPVQGHCDRNTRIAIEALAAISGGMGYLHFLEKIDIIDTKIKDLQTILTSHGNPIVILNKIEKLEQRKKRYILGKYVSAIIAVGGTIAFGIDTIGPKSTILLSLGITQADLAIISRNHSITNEPYKQPETYVNERCPICWIKGNGNPLTDFIILSCGHRICKECLQRQTDVCINSSDINQLQCPFQDCNHTITIEELEELYKNKENRAGKIERLKTVSSNHWLRTKGYIKCPTEGCTHGFKFTGEPIRRTITCNGCGTQYCTLCHENHPNGTSCNDQFITKLKQAGLIKNCPRCNQLIEKNGGCLHMSCSQCNHQFCWICLQPWNTHGRSWYRCTKTGKGTPPS